MKSGMSKKLIEKKASVRRGPSGKKAIEKKVVKGGLGIHVLQIRMEDVKGNIKMS